MTVDTTRVKALFLAASELADWAQRAAFLQRECGDDVELRARVESLLRAHDAAPLLTVEPPSETEDYGAIRTRVGEILAGKYKLVEGIGAGGMGSVFMAQQIEPVKRAVAIKVIKAGMDSKAILARFEAERQALAMMDHPNIARVLDAGATAAGSPFFVMELVKGTPITQFCDERKLSPRQRLELFVPICQAIQHAHQKGIIHRDIKPSNVLVAMYDDRPVPKVIDFGVAKAAGHSLTDKTLMTGFGAVVGTPEYMSPEQANLNNLDIDTRSDVYSLGVLLYELLTGTTPVDRKSLGEAAYLEVLRIVREVDAPRPSSKLSTIATRASVAANRGTEPAKLSKLLKGELDWLVLKALEKDRTRRYETANGLARDVQRYLADELVEARPPSITYWLKKFVRRHPLELALAAMIGLVAVGGVTVAWWQNEQASARRQMDLQRELEDQKRLAAETARLDRNAQAMAALLNQCEAALKASDASNASVALDAARKRSAEGGAVLQTQRLERLAADLAVLQELDAIDQFRWTWVVDQFADEETVATRTREALRQFGVAPETVSVDQAASRVSASVVRERLVMALDLCLLREQASRLREVLRRVDPDAYRDAVRDAIVTDEWAEFAELADQPAAEEQPPGFVAIVSKHAVISTERRRELLEAAVSRRPGDLGLLMELGETYPLQGDENVAARLRWYQAAVAANPTNPAAINNLGVTLNHARQLDEAIRYLKKAIQLDPTLAPAFNNLGVAMGSQGDLDAAIGFLRQAIELYPTMASAHLNLGISLHDNNQWLEAIECFQIAIAIEPNLPGHVASLGTSLHAIGDLDAAIVCFEHAIALDSTSADTHANLGAALYNKGQIDSSIRHCKQAIALDPQSPTVHCNLGRIRYQLGELDEAIACFEKAIEVVPSYAPAYLELGSILCDNKKDFDGAIACFEKALTLDPNSTHAQTCMGTALFGRGQIDEALVLFRKVIELDPTYYHARVNLASGLLRSAGVVTSATSLDRENRAHMRKEALEQLRVALALQATQLESDAPANQVGVQKTLERWQQDPDFAPIRDTEALDLLPADEQEAFAQLWADVEELLRKAELPAPRVVSAEYRNPLVWAAENAVRRVKAELGPEHRLTLECMNGLTVLYLESHKFDKSVPLSRELLNVRKPLLGLNHPDTLQSMQHLAEAYLQSGEHDAAVKLFEETLELRKATLGRNHPQTLVTMTLLAGAYREAKQFDQAIGLCENAMKRLEAYLGRQHEQTQSVVANLGVNYLEAGRLEDAIAVLEEAHVAARKHPRLRWVLTPLLQAYMQSGRTEKSIELLQETFEIQTATLGPNHFATLMSMEMLAWTCWTARRFDESIPLYEELLKHREAKLGRSDVATLATVANLGVNYKDAGRFDEAMSLLEEANGAADDHAELGFVPMQLLNTYAQAGEDAKFTELLQQLLAEARGALPGDSSQFAQLLAHFSLMLLDLKRWSEAEPLLVECLAIRKNIESDDWRTFNTQAMLGGALLGQGKFVDAEPLLLSGYEGMKARLKAIPPDGRPRLFEAIDRLIDLYTAMNKPDEVKKWQTERTSMMAGQ